MPILITEISVDGSGIGTPTPPSQTVLQPNTTLTYALTPKSLQNWKVTGIQSTDSKQQISNITITADGGSVSVLDVNSQAEVFNVSVLVAHRSSGEQKGIDPEVINDPQ